MNKLISIALLVCGVVLMYFGFNTAHSLDAEGFRFISGTPPDRNAGMLISGIMATIVGLGLTLLKWKST